MTLQYKDLEKAFEKGLSDVLSRDDTLVIQIQNTIKYIFFILFKKINYHTYKLHNKKISVAIPNFLKHNSFSLENVTSKEFNYKRKIGVSFAIQKSQKSTDDFITNRKNEVEAKKWIYLNEVSINIKSKYDYSQIIFQHRIMDYYKALFIKK